MKLKYSSPIFCTSKIPAPVPMSLSLISSTRLTIVAPTARAIRLLSVFRNRRIADIPCFAKKWVARSLSPFSVITRSGLNDAMVAQTLWIQSSSILRSTAQSSSFMSSTFVWFSPFLYSREQSSKRMRGFLIWRRIRPGATTSLLNMTPFSTRQSSIVPPGSFSTFANFFMSISRLPSWLTFATHRTASSANSEISVPKRVVNFVPIQLFIMFSICARSEVSIGKERSSRIEVVSSKACR
mmetsp:Transcript_10364/g.36110  ORF Transcript_10364/g.36110 Transcript_10364/m.36110 type:complete len:240 (+) Transcript_10364:846-1565(+)